MLKKLFHREPLDIPADISTLQKQKDVAGLVRVLKSESAEVAGAAVDAIVSLYQDRDNATRQRAEATAPALLDACGRWMYRSQGSYGVIMSSAVVVWKLIDALGEIRAREAVPFLVGLTDGRTSRFRRDDDTDRECHAARALGRIADPKHPEALAKLLNGPKDLREMVLTGLVENGDEGLRFLRGCLLAHSIPLTEVHKALENEAAGGSHAALARTILEEVDAAEQEAERRREEERLAKEKEREAQEKELEAQKKKNEAALEQKLAMYPLAAELAGLLGHPEWVVDNETIKPGGDHINYIECLAVCKRLGLTISENEKIEPWMGGDSSVQWADVWFKGKLFKIDGGRTMYFGNEW